MDRLKHLFDVILDEAEHNPTLAARLIAIMDQTSPPGEPAAVPPRRGNRRPPGAIDPFTAFEQGEDHLRQQLEALDIEQLKDIIAEHGMDRAKLAVKWKKKDRLTDLIVTTVHERVHKGDAFKRAP